MISGPGSMTTVIVLTGDAHTTPNKAILFLAIVVAMVIPDSAPAAP